MANNDTIGITTSSQNTPFCIDVLSNDIVNANTALSSTINGAGAALVDGDPVFVAEVRNRIAVSHKMKISQTWFQ